METRKILFGFSDEKFESSICDLLKKIDVEAETFARTSKAAVHDTLKKNPDMDAVVLTETVQGSGLKKREKYTAEELASLAEESNANVIVVLSENHVGTDYVRVLLDAGVTCALFVGAKASVTAKEVAALILRKRTKREAREIYGVGGGHVDLGFIERDAFNELFSRYKSRDGSPIENYLYICGNLPGPKEIVDFTKRLPKDEIDYLASFEEFHDVMGALKKLGYDLKISKPKKTQIGSRDPLKISVSGGTMVIEPKSEVPVKKAEEDGAQADKEKKGFSLFGKKKDAASSDADGKKEDKSADAPKEKEVGEEVKELGAENPSGEDLGGGPDAKGEEPAAAGMEADQGDYGEFGDMSIEDMLAMMGASEDAAPQAQSDDEMAQEAERERYVAEAARKAKAEEERRKAEEERRRAEEERRARELEEQKRAEAAERAAFEEKARQKAAEDARRAAENARRAEENARRAEEKKKADEAKKAEKAKREEEKRLAKEEAKKAAAEKEREEREERERRKADEMLRRLESIKDDGLLVEFPVFDEDVEDVELGGSRRGRNGLYLLAVIILLALLGGLWYLEGGGGIELPWF